MHVFQPLNLQATITWAVCSYLAGTCALIPDGTSPAWPASAFFMPTLNKQIWTHIWPLGASTTTPDGTGSAYLRESPADHLGHGTAPEMHVFQPLNLQIFCVARLQSFPGGLQHAAHQSPAPQAKLPLHALDASAGIHRLHCAVDTLPSAPHECPSIFPPVPPSLLPPFPSWSRGTETELTSHRYDKSFTKGRMLFSGLGSTSAMARTHMQRLLFVQLVATLLLIPASAMYWAGKLRSTPCNRLSSCLSTCQPHMRT
ncbi:uncharacterized protein LOC142785004 [Rhipicephalus microplus]|uniref:uncharacterized protein LOC142785004 n=1 Tax=Rhipicephalus microplus TaxID=6941 RepID=UPI003F6CAD86